MDDLQVISFASDLAKGLGDQTHLGREKAVEKLRASLQSYGQDQALELTNALKPHLFELLSSEAWEKRLGGFKGSQVILEAGSDQDLQELLLKHALRCLEDSEVRVRQAVGDLLGMLAKLEGTSLYEKVSKPILESIESSFDRDDGGRTTDDEDSAAGDSAGFMDQMMQQVYKVDTPGKGQMRHMSEGWKCLETSYRALQKVMEGCGEDFGPFLTPALRDLIYRSLLHPNRFVREIGYFVIRSMVSSMPTDLLVSVSDELSKQLSDGLSDNWSQVRYAASVATRAFVEALPGEAREACFSVLLPPMCLNRYYVAEGVRLYSQETWRLVMGDGGREWTAKFANEVVSYYIAQSKANNHAVREAACACIAELMVKVDSDAVRPHVSRLLGALLLAFKDASWPVRDAACVATGRCVGAFKEETLPMLDDLYELWFAHLWDNIPSVREDSAVALGNVVRSYGQEAVDKIVEKMKVMLPHAKEQPSESHRYAGLDNTTTFGVAAKRARDNDEALHTNQTMFSCGSLAPKLQRGSGCMDHGFSREKEPWEASDGALYMLRELAQVAPKEVPRFLPDVAEIAGLKHFAHAVNLHETIWKCLPKIATGMGKKAFKPYVEMLLDPMFHSLSCGHQLAEVAAGECIGAIRDLLGPNIFAGRLSDQQQLEMSNPNIPPPKLPSGPTAMGRHPVGNLHALGTPSLGVQ
uniref:Arm repeat-containing protein n=1 Tax=Tetraselmis sp. GSL018 TaxID=582737 RepID=A0A061QRH4_9CHLO|mmetsp:Transcript_8428/g.20232  ORF Transcript_8428/g.20232 Transcript_8428/m.20232 type:complete len:696 (-) Transcript_8428:216-2303(-)|eukprot:CAMPEP_0177621078 /NCGR_PEP_ID=MMETSP0419_2-20121207/27353_1 /TAXON_ID=582737 /ORGANISM="Tetraselmis sp., Strain GSL018" /LENGTH=695 /DNA_ID=CAMNT_0019120891 /DNA_START=112 /DNA_END=2199 /DNA_ORIENTATION=+